MVTTGAARWHDLPNAPILSEAGFKDFVMENYGGPIAPAATSPEIIARLMEMRKHWSDEQVVGISA